MLHTMYLYSILHLQNTFYARLWRDLQTLINTQKKPCEDSHTCPYFVIHLHTNTHTEICTHMQKPLHMHTKRHCMGNSLSETVHYATSNEHVVIYKIMYFIYMCSVNLQNVHIYVKLSAYTHTLIYIHHTLADLRMQENSFSCTFDSF